VQVVEAVSGRRAGGTGGSQPSTSPVARADKQRAGRADCEPARHPSGLGACKVQARLKALGLEGVPAPSTVHQILWRQGRVDPAAKLSVQSTPSFPQFPQLLPLEIQI